MSVNNTNVYSFKSASSQLNNYKIYGSDKYTANYKIYGNTIDGSSVGNLVNLFDENSEVITCNYINDNGVLTNNTNIDTYDYISVEPNTTYRAKSFGIGSEGLWIRVAYYDSSKTFISRTGVNKNNTFTTPINCVYIRLSIDNPKPIHDLQISLTKGNEDPATYEPYGYKVPIRITGKNLIYLTGNPSVIKGVEWSRCLDGAIIGKRVSSNEAVSDFTYAINIPIPSGNYKFSVFDSMSTASGSTYQANIIINGQSHWGIGIYTFTITEETYIKIVLRVYPSFNDEAVFYPMICRADIEDSTYEPYRESIENVYLDSPLTKSGDNCDYIDFKEQKRVNINGTEEYIKLPELKIESENDSIFIDTDIQPSNIDFDILHGVGDRTENLFDVTKITPGYWINVLTGALTATQKSDLSDYIPVSQGITYTLSWSQIGNLYSSSNREYVFFDSNKMIIPGGSVYNITQNNSCSITAPNGAAYIRFDYDKSFTDITLNEPFGYKIPIKVQGKNLFIKPVEQGSITAATGGYNSSNTTRIYSKNIPLIPGKTYTISCNNNLKFRLITLYFNDTYIGQLYLNDTSSTAESQTTISIPENAYNISVSF